MREEVNDVGVVGWGRRGRNAERGRRHTCDPGMIQKKDTRVKEGLKTGLREFNNSGSVVAGKGSIHSSAHACSAIDRVSSSPGGHCLHPEEGIVHGGRLVGRRGLHWRGRAALIAVPWVLVLVSLGTAEGDRAGEALFFDGAQYPFNNTSPPSPGHVFVTPRKAPPDGPINPWFEFPGSFTVQFWMRPVRVFVGTDVEGGLIGCLVRQTIQGGTGIKSGYGLTITADARLHFIATVGAETADVPLEVEVNVWSHITAIYDAQIATTKLYYSPGLGDPPVFVGSHFFEAGSASVFPKPVTFFYHNDLIFGKFQPLYDQDYYYSGYMDEVRFWGSALSAEAREMSLYRSYAPDGPTLRAQGLVGYYGMNSVVCTEKLCGEAASLQQWIQVGGTGKFTSSIVLKGSPFDLSEPGLDCRQEKDASLYQSCICNEKVSDYCWDAVRRIPALCSTCPGCQRIQCYGPYGAPKCLTVRGGIRLVNGAVQPALVELNACSEGSTSQTWTKFAGVGQLQLAGTQAATFMCLATTETKPYRGTSVSIETCDFDDRPARQMWTIDGSTLSLRNQLTEMCLSSSSSLNGDLPYMVDCLVIAPPGSSNTVQGFAFDFAGGRNGAMIGGSYLSDSYRCTGLTQCSAAIKAPIDQAPRIVAIDGYPITSYLQTMSGSVNELLELTISTFDPNRNDPVEIEFSPYDRNLLTDPSVTWPDAYRCEGGSRPGSTCSCTASGCLPCPGGGTCVRNLQNPCPANPCTRTFQWLPTLSTLFSNPSTFIFLVSDIPTNEYDPDDVAPVQFDTALQVVVSVNMPPEFIEPTPPYTCEGGLTAGSEYPARADCLRYCEEEGGGECLDANVYVALGNSIEFIVKAANRQPGSKVQILFVGEGPGGLAPPESRLKISENLPTKKMITDGSQLKEVLEFNPTYRVWKFTPNAIDAKRVYQQCFLANNPDLPFIPSTQTEVKCVNVHVRTTQPIFENPSPANGSTIVGNVGCPLRFQMAALKNDTALYDLLVYPRGTRFQTFNGTYVDAGLLPGGAFFNTQSATDVTLVYSLQWTPEVGQEGSWEMCFSTSDSFLISTEIRCVNVEVQRCVRCILPGESLEKIGQMYNSHWLELYSINPALHLNPTILTPGERMNVGVMYRTPRSVTLTDLAKYLHVTPSAVRRLNPDISADDELLFAFKKICVLPSVCGNTCGEASYCDRVQIEGLL